MQFYNNNVEEIVTHFGSDINNGINSVDVKDRINEYGYNVMEKKKKKGIIKKFFLQFDNAMILILVFSAVISFFLAFDSGSKKEFLEPAVILFIVFLNATLGVIQESKAEHALDELSKLSSSSCIVIRDGKEMDVDTSSLVPGDIVLLKLGDLVPADCRVVEEYGLKVDESFLTGESLAVVKTSDTIKSNVTSVGDIHNMLFSGSSIMMGKCKAIVCATGMKTKIGDIASYLKDESVKTPIEKKLETLSKYIGFFALLLCIIIFLIGITSGMNVSDMFMI